MGKKKDSDVLVMAVFMVTRDDVFACAEELGLPVDRLTEDAIEHIKGLVSEELGDWHSAIRGIIKEAIRESKMACPIGLLCTPDCFFRQVGQCEVPGVSD